jgi:hypothetical protein
MNQKQHIDFKSHRCEQCEYILRELIAEKDAFIAALKDEIQFLRDANNKLLEKLEREQYEIADQTMQLLKKPEVSDADSINSSQP